MKEQLSFELTEINREKTKTAVESTLEKYRYYLLSVPEEKLPKITATYSLVPSGPSNQFHSNTESVAIDKVAFECEREKYIEWVRRGVNRLNVKEREMVIKRYLSDDDTFDYQVYSEMNMSERQYYRLKSRVFYKLAFALKIEVYEEQVIA